MDRVKVPSGSIQKLEDVFDDLQTLVHANLNKRIDAITSQYGILNALENGAQVSSSVGLKVSVSSINDQTMTIQPGVALLADGSILLVETGINFTLSDSVPSPGTSTHYQINLRYIEVGTDPIVAQNAFFFDKAGLTPYSQRFSRWSDSYEVVAYPRSSGNDIVIPTNEIALAIVQTATVSTKLMSSFSYQDENGDILPSTDSTIDLRKDSTYRINHDVLDDSLILFKDRNSIGANKINGSLEAIGLLSNTLTVSGLSTLSTTNINGALTVTNTNASYATIKAGNTYNAGLLFEDVLGSRGYAVFDYNHNFIVGFAPSLSIDGDTPSTPPTIPALVATSNGYIGNFISPSYNLHIRNSNVNLDETIFRLEHVPATTSESTLFNFGVEYTGGTDPSYGRGYIKPITYNRPFEFLNTSGNYVIRIDNANRKVYAYSLEVENSTSLSIATITSATINTLTANLLNASASTINSLTLSGLTIPNNDASNIYLPGTAVEEFRVGVGSVEYPEGRAVMLEDPDVNTPSNFRIYDISPSSNYRESYSYIHLKWNWDGLNGTKQNSNEVVLNATTTLGETLNLTAGAASIRQFYFSSSGNIYDIDSYSPTTRTVTLAENYTGSDIINDMYPAKIIDPNVTYYTIRAIEQDTSGGGLTTRATIVTLDYDNIALNPEHTFKLELNKKWSISIKAGNRDHSSPYITMLPGMYDPDHISGSQSNVSYTSPIYNRLPYIDGAVSPGTLTLTSTSYGFRLDIEGWESESTETSPHEFEVGYTTFSGITWENSAFGTTKKSGATFVRTVNRTLQVSTNSEATWTVGVRPIQNNQPVGVPILGIVTSGGGGIVPSDSIVVGPFNFNIVVASGIIISSGITVNDIDISGSNNELWGEGTLNGSVITFGTEETKILTNTLRFTEI